MKEIFGFDAFSPVEIAEKIERIGVVKARLPFTKMFLLGVLAGAFIGLGAMYYVVILSDQNLTFGLARILGGVAFSLGLLLVVVAGAELFTGNNLLVMAWADNKITFRELLRNWAIVCFANFIGAFGLALLVYLSKHAEMQNGAIAQQYLKIATYKSNLPFAQAYFSGVLCNVLVCLAVWMASAGRTVTDKLVAIIFPVSAFVAAGFEHSIANMYFIPMGILLQLDNPVVAGTEALSWLGLLHNLLPVILGNITGGAVFVATFYHFIYAEVKDKVQ